VDYGGGSWVPAGGILAPQGQFGYFTSVACNHCEKPLCADVCPAGAIYKNEDGILLIDEELCIGCRYCEWACPYGAPQFNEELGVMTKCNFCYDLIAESKEPACVSACPMRVLEFGEIEQLRAKYGDVVEIEPLPSKEITKPALVLKPHRDAQVTGAGTGRILDMEGEI
jgi:anaerobic dimethyl sulfoxide reductase subunit B (iron-sulfur subunit)